MSWNHQAVAVVTFAFALVACGSGPEGPGNPAGPTSVAPISTTAAVLIGAGDIADCNNDAGRPAEDTAKLLDKLDGSVFTAGDNAYRDGTAADLTRCYDPRWGRHKSRTWPVPGNHDYNSPGAAPYYEYFGDAAGPSGLGFYSYSLGAWHIVSLNSNIAATSGSVQWAWLRDDLAANPTRCAAAVFHHPRFSTGPSGGGFMRAVWPVLYEFGVDVVVNGHDHVYERFALQDPDGGLNIARGIRQFTVGTGGAPLYPFFGSLSTSEVRVRAYGVLRLTLRENSYDWAFIEAVTEVIRDSGTTLCR